MKKITIGLLFVLAVTLLAWFSVAVAVVAISATVLCALHAKADSLIEISFGPLKAKLEREISDAEKLVGELRSLATLQAKVSIGASARTGRWGGRDDWQFLNLKQIEAALRNIGSSETEIREARGELTKFFLIDLGHAAMGSSLLPAHLSQEAQLEWKEIRTLQEISDPEKVETWLRKWNEYTPERAQLVEDMRWVVANQDIRDREQFLRCHLDLPWQQ